jgi:hypothetical protein
MSDYAFQANSTYRADRFWGSYLKRYAYSGFMESVSRPQSGKKKRRQKAP